MRVRVRVHGVHMHAPVPMQVAAGEPVVGLLSLLDLVWPPAPQLDTIGAHVPLLSLPLALCITRRHRGPLLAQVSTK